MTAPPGDFRACAVVPTFENPATLGTVVRKLRDHFDSVYVVDDGSGPEGRAAAARLGDEGLAKVTLLPHNRGKGHAVLAGFAAAAADGFTHGLQVDADDQHCTDDVPRFLEEARQRPDALVCGVPVFDSTAPKSRVIGRKISIFWVDLEVGRGVIADPLYGFRVYPLRSALDAGTRSLRMGFDTDIAVRMVWRGTPTVSLRTKVRYFEGGVSHFRPLASNAALFRLHTGLFFGSLRWRLWGRRRLGAR